MVASIINLTKMLTWINIQLQMVLARMKEKNRAE